jgi:hypothetical protein
MTRSEYGSSQLGQSVVLAADEDDLFAGKVHDQGEGARFLAQLRMPRRSRSVSG